MERRRSDWVIFVCLLLCLSTITHESATESMAIPVGVILDSNSSLGSMVLSCINIGLQDFYAANDSYVTNITLLFRDPGNDLLTAFSTAWDLIYRKNVQAILGPKNSEQAMVIVELCAKYDVPVIWFSPSGPSLLPPRSPFSIHSNTTRSICLQFEAIAAIIKAYGWQCVIPIYEEPEFGNDLIPCLTYALQEMDTRVPKTSPIHPDFSDDGINKELDKIKDNKGKCLFLAHMTVELWSRLVELAQKEGMMDKGYAWILTQGLSSVLDPGAKDIQVKGYMDGVLGVRPSLVPRPSRNVYNITRRKRLSLAETLMSEYNKTLSLYGLWAYDTITALAKAVETASLVNSDENRVNLREAIKTTYFLGLSGDFSLRQGQLEPSRFVVYNVKEKRDMIIGYWSPKTGLYYQNDSAVVEWPGNAEERPTRLRIGVPNKTHFAEFVSVSGEGESISATGFAVDVFYKVIHVLPFNLSYDFVIVMNSIYQDPTDLSSYEQLLCDIKDKNVDVIIGDITILESRSDCVDFTMPYLDSSLSMMVKVGYDSKSDWILFTPFDSLLWFILGWIFVGATISIIILESKWKDVDGSKFTHFVRNPFLIYMSDVDSLKNVMSKLVVIVVMFLLGIAIQIYTANLTSILKERTTEKPSPWKDLQEIKRNNVSVGYQRDSWVKGLLMNQIGFTEDQLKPLGSFKEYNEALSKGAKEGGVEIIIDETPYLLLLQSKCSSCKMTGPIYKTGGFAFAFPKKSTWVASFSSAILQVTQNATIFCDLKKNRSLPVTVDKSEYKSNVEWRSLTIDDFGGLFPMVLFVLVLFFSLSILKVPCITRGMCSIYQSLCCCLPLIALWLHNKSLVSFFRVSPE